MQRRTRRTANLCDEALHLRIGISAFAEMVVTDASAMAEHARAAYIPRSEIRGRRTRLLLLMGEGEGSDEKLGLLSWPKPIALDVQWCWEGPRLSLRRDKGIYVSSNSLGPDSRIRGFSVLDADATFNVRILFFMHATVLVEYIVVK